MIEKLKSLFRKEWTFSSSNTVKNIIRSFSVGEKAVFFSLFGIFTLSALALLWQVNTSFLVQVPAHGGTLTEGIVGSSRFVNPLLATSDPDKDLTTLVYSGLLRNDPTRGLVGDLASSYTISSDGLIYIFVLKDNARFQDGTKVTADDVVFTVFRAQDPALKSPRLGAWAGVTATKVDDRTVTFSLKQPYAPFIYSTTLGILPKHIWNNVTDDSFPFSQFNVKPVGTGPYHVSKVVTDNSGLPTEYDLDANGSYTLGEPYISHIVIKFYQNEIDMINAYNKKDIDAMSSVTPQNMILVKRNDGVVNQATLSRVFGVFFNQNQNPVLVNKEVRQALAVTIDKQSVVKTVLQGYGTAIDGPLPTDLDTAGVTGSSTDRIAQAKKILEKAGWTLSADGIYQKVDKKTKKVTQTLSLSLSTSDVPELKSSAELIQQAWTAMGAKVDVKIFEIGDLNQNIIRPRKYDALLFGEIISAGGDLYPFWHSSERNDPGLNVAMYTNIKADGLLENMRKTSDENIQTALEKKFETEVNNDIPAIFLYSPDLIYILPQSVHNAVFSQLTTASDRFENISQWYITTNSIWSLFVKK